MSTSRLAIRKGAISMVLLVVFALLAGLFGSRLSAGFLPEEDQGYLYGSLAVALCRLDGAHRQCRAQGRGGVAEHARRRARHERDRFQPAQHRPDTPSTRSFSSRSKPGTSGPRLTSSTRRSSRAINEKLAAIPEGIGFAFPPPAIPGIGTSGGVTFMLEDRAGRDVGVSRRKPEPLSRGRRKRPEIASATSTFLPSVPQVFIDVDRDKVLKQGVDLTQVSQTLQTFMGGYFVNYFNRFGRQWQVFVQAEGEYPNQGGKRRPVSCSQCEQRNGPAQHGDECANARRAGVHDALQPVSRRADQRHRRAGVQLRARR